MYEAMRPAVPHRTAGLAAWDAMTAATAPSPTAAFSKIFRNDGICRAYSLKSDQHAVDMNS